MKRLLLLAAICAVSAFGQASNPRGKAGGDLDGEYPDPPLKKGIAHLYLGTDTSDYFSGALLAPFSSGAINEIPWGVTVANDGNGYVANGFWFKNATTGAYYDLFYTGVQVTLNGSGIGDKVYYIESVDGATYANEWAVRPHMITVRRDTANCWSDIDDAVGLGLLTPTALNPDACFRHPAPGEISAETGQAGVGAILKAGSIVIGSIQLVPTIDQPACDVTVKGTTWYTAGGAGVADKYEVCVKDDQDAYTWHSALQ